MINHNTKYIILNKRYILHSVSSEVPNISSIRTNSSLIPNIKYTKSPMTQKLFDIVASNISFEFSIFHSLFFLKFSMLASNIVEELLPAGCLTPNTAWAKFATHGIVIGLVGTSRGSLKWLFPAAEPFQPHNRVFVNLLLTCWYISASALEELYCGWNIIAMHCQLCWVACVSR